jgi:hypothetical protein
MGRSSHLDSDAMDTIPEPKIIRSHPSGDCLIYSHVLNEDTSDSSQTFVNNFNINISNDQFYTSISRADNNSSINLFIDIQYPISTLTLRPIYYPTCVRDHNHFYRPLFKRSEALINKKEHNLLLCHKQVRQKNEMRVKVTHFERFK